MAKITPIMLFVYSECSEVDASVHPCSKANEIGAVAFIPSIIILHEKDCNVSIELSLKTDTEFSEHIPFS